MTEPLLAVEGLTAGYGTARVLFGIDLAVGAGEVVTLMGKNGMGRTTTLRAIMGLIPRSDGRVRFASRDLAGLPPHRVAAAGIGWVPEGRRVFRALGVEENLQATAQPGPWDLDRVYALFPRLRERRRQSARTLSGGEAQMLALGRALMTNPRLLLLDEATEGLAPVVAEEIWRCLRSIKAEGTAVLIVDKHVDPLIPLTDRHNVIEKGCIVWRGDGRALVAERERVNGLVGL